MSWTRRSGAALVACVLLPAGVAGCGTSDAGERKNGESPPAVGRLLDDTDEAGRPYREVRGEDAPEVGVEVQPDTSGAGWDVRLTLRDFRLSPAGTARKASPGRGVARLFLDGRPVAELRAPEHRLATGLVPRGTHQVTARLYADDGTVWAVDGEPVESTADITASGSEPSESTATMSAPATDVRTGGRGSPDPGGKAS
ncbi:hypothetical protein I2W78_32710 [Streptomyces spinoverrucosus]|uniref:hypothetical protein n=1 Tax=Streptomyces spinoverrucosus TaxID=284043 RepID=UPI0018C3638B|nr:hypothetical protein [Streptomyces spinoverrucosus]MBG0856491.1 hypothetical protein [Streptomyces spinoverrucosus]